MNSKPSYCKEISWIELQFVICGKRAARTLMWLDLGRLALVQWHQFMVVGIENLYKEQW